MILEPWQLPPLEVFIFNYQMIRLQPEEDVPSADSELCVNGTAADWELNGRPSRFECQPYWLSLITPHSAFVYGGNESLTNRGIPQGGGIVAAAAAAR